MNSYNKYYNGGRVNTGTAPYIQSERVFNNADKVCILRPNISDDGVVGVSRNSINTMAAGCNSPMERVSVENRLRPMYLSQLNEYIQPNARSVINYDSLTSGSSATSFNGYQVLTRH